MHRLVSIRSALLVVLAVLLIKPVMMTSSEVQAIGSSQEWQVVFFNPVESDKDLPVGEFVVVSQDGLGEAIPIPEAVYDPVLSEDEDEAPAYAVARLSVSSDQQWLAVSYGPIEDASLPALPVGVFNLQTGDSFEIEMPAEFPLLYNYTFSPNAEKIALTYVGAENADAAVQDGEVIGGMMLVDLASGEVEAQIDMAEVNDAIDSENEDVWGLIVSWVDGESVPFVPACFFCQQIQPDLIQLWNPAENTFTETEQYYFNFGSLLPESGEVVAATLNPGYPLGNEEDVANAYLPPSNVIEYYAPGDDPRREGEVVFFDDSRFPLGGSPWVQDGRAFLTRQQGDPDAVLIFRDGSQVAFTLPTGPVIVIGTPDGAIIVDEDGIVYDYRVVNGEMTGEEITQLNFGGGYSLDTVNVVYSTPIGETSTGKPFPGVAEPGSTAMR
jgi:hypothetical protein